jgi:predicted phosphate transport protein (TIGR00153 family)
MRNPFIYLFYKKPFENLKKHSEKVRDCAQLFSEAVSSHLNGKIKEFELLTDHVAKLESEADAIKRNIRGHLPRGVLMPVDKFQFFMYLREQDYVLDAVENALFWLSYGPKGVGHGVAEDLKFLVASVIPAIEKLSPLIEMAITYFRTKSKEDRAKMKSLIREIRQHEHESDHLERELIRRIFAEIKNPLEVFHLIRLVETIGTIADHAQNASDMMRGMIAV